jgi:hypothetical protein
MIDVVNFESTAISQAALKIGFVIDVSRVSSSTSRSCPQLDNLANWSVRVAKTMAFQLLVVHIS